MELDEEKSLEILKKILLAESLEKVRELENNFSEYKLLLNNKEYQISTLYPIITDIIERKINHSKKDVIKTLSPVIGPAIKKQVTESREDVIDALYPIIGETIKKSIAENMKLLYQSLNNKIENTLNKGIFSKFVTSKISGVSATDLVLQDSFPFELKEIFLIHENSGILISHISSSKYEKTSDADLISGMLTAIKNFVSESFKSDSGSQNLYEIQYGESKIILERGRYSYLAVVVLGQEPQNFYVELSNLNNKIHKRYYKILREFDGVIEPLKDVELPLKEFVNSKYQITNEKQKEKPTPYLVYLLGIILLIILIIVGIFTLPKFFKEKSINNQVKARLSLLNKSEIENINWIVNNDELKISGIVNSRQIKFKVDSLLKSIPDLNKIDNNLGIIFPVVSSEQIVRDIQDVISKSDFAENKNINYSLDKDVLTIYGDADNFDEKIKISNLIGQIPGIRILINNLEVRDSNFTDEEAEELIKKMTIYFDFNKTSLTKKYNQMLNSITPFLIRNNIKLTILGYPDNIGNIEINILKAKKRMQNVANYLISQGVDKEKLDFEVFETSSDQENKDGYDGRKINFRIKYLR